MDDLIERKPLYERAARLEAEALDYASKLIERESNGEATSEEWRIWSAVLAERTAFKHDVLDAPSAEPEPKWIPCSERLPKAAVRYLVTFKSGEVGYSDFRNKIFLWDGSVKENVWETEPYYEEDGEVIAWMELPSPYKEENR